MSNLTPADVRAIAEVIGSAIMRQALLGIGIDVDAIRSEAQRDFAVIRMHLNVRIREAHGKDVLTR